MKRNQKISAIEKIIVSLVIPVLVIPLILYLYLETEIDQLGEAFIYGPKYTLIPLFLLFTAILYPIHKNLIVVLMRSIPYSLIYGLCAIFPVLLINNHVGEHKDYNITGIIVDTKPGKGNSKPSVTVKKQEENITFRLDRDKWLNLSVGKNVSFKAKKGSLGLIYK